MTLLAELGRTLGFSFAAGINLYATVAILGLAGRFGWVALPPQYQVFDNNWIIGGAIALYVVEFFADKVPWLDSVWDAIHTVVRPLGGAFIAVTTLGHASPFAETMIALLGGTLAAGSHAGKAGTRLIANASPEPFSNWILSLAEDAFVVALGFLALKYPLAAGFVVLVSVVVLIVLARWIVRAVRQRFRRRDGGAPGGHTPESQESGVNS
ncbi:MAG TPA: DUF4126 domain-containing protein [Vicinamibacterales bacterium]|jgi:hypothetical protein